MTDQQNSPIIPEDVTESVRETMQGYGNAASDGRQWNIYLAMRFAETAVLADRSRRAKAPREPLKSPQYNPDEQKRLSEQLKAIASEVETLGYHGIAKELLACSSGLHFPGPPDVRPSQIAPHLRAAGSPPAEAKPVAWSVKPLEWRKVGDSRQAECTLGWYAISTSYADQGKWFNVRLKGNPLDSFRNEQDAVDFAQQHFEGCINSAIIVHPDPRAKATEAVPEHRLYHGYFDLDAADAAMRAMHDGRPLQETFATYKAGPLEADALLKWYAWYVRAAAPRPLSTGGVE